VNKKKAKEVRRLGDFFTISSFKLALTILAGEKFAEREKTLGPEKILGLEKTLTTDNVWIKNSLSSSFAGFEVPNNKPSTKINTL
jgi:hypothetical protein